MDTKKNSACSACREQCVQRPTAAPLSYWAKLSVKGVRAVESSVVVAEREPGEGIFRGYIRWGPVDLRNLDLNIKGLCF